MMSLLSPAMWHLAAHQAAVTVLPSYAVISSNQHHVVGVAQLQVHVRDVSVMRPLLIIPSRHTFIILELCSLLTYPYLLFRHIVCMRSCELLPSWFKILTDNVPSWFKILTDNVPSWFKLLTDNVLYSQLFFCRSHKWVA